MSKKHTETPADEFPVIPEPEKQRQTGPTTHFPAEDEVAPPVPGRPLQPAELDQDPGGGYNPDGTYPQT